jgi:hypothetical protein
MGVRGREGKKGGGKGREKGRKNKDKERGAGSKASFFHFTATFTVYRSLSSLVGWSEQHTAGRW